MEALEALEEVTGDDENASLGDDQEDDWSDDAGDFGGINGEGNLPPGALGGLVLEPGSGLLEQIRQGGGDMADFLDDEMAEEGKLQEDLSS
jgi:E3 ubiquitin-protein ligase HUWE1